MPVVAKRLLEVLYLLLGLVGLVALGFGIVWVLNATLFSPGSAAQSYVGLIADGRVAEANAVIDPAVPDEQAGLLVDAALADPADRIADVHVVSTEIDGPQARVVVGYRVGGDEEQATLSMERIGSTLGVIGHWAPTEPLLSPVELDVLGPEQVEVNGVSLPVADGASIASAYPGVYHVGVPESDAFFTADPVAVPLTGSTETAAVSLEVAATPALQQAVDERLHALIDSDCATVDSLWPAGCPFGSRTDAEYQNVHWTITAYPQTAVAPDGLTFTTATPGTAHADYERANYTGKIFSPASLDSPIDAHGAISVVGGAVELTLDG